MKKIFFIAMAIILSFGPVMAQGLPVGYTPIHYGCH